MQTGALICERFLLEAVAGHGGMGVVYRARDTLSQESVALKMLLRATTDGRARFLREAEILSDLKHPNIVRYVTHGETEDKIPFLAMEWLQGKSLETRLREGPLRVTEATQLTTKIAEALVEAHRRGVIHRDIKPSNLFLVDNQLSRVKLLDFGIARNSQVAFEVTNTGVMLGSAGYMAPEQARGVKNIDGRADIFSLGVVLFECLTGQMPFSGNHPIAILTKIIFEDAPRLRSLRPEMPASLDALLVRLLAKNREERVSSAKEVIEALSALEDSQALLETSPAPLALPTGEQRLLGVVLLSSVLTPSVFETSSPTRPIKVEFNTRFHQSSEAPHPPALYEAATMDAAEAISDEQKALDSLRDTAERFGGQVEPLADGSLVATFIGRGEAIDQAAQTARCALALRQLLPDAKMALALGLGSMRPWPLGEVVDRAASLLRAGEAHSAGIGIFVDESTAALLEQRFLVRREGAWASLESEREGALSARTLLGRPAPCIGRERELAYLQKIFADCVQTPRARAVLVTAPAGTGKSRLGYELSRKAEGLVFIGKGDPMRQDAPFAMLSQALRDSAGIRVDDKPPRRARKLSALVKPFVPTYNPSDHYPEAQRLLEFLGELAGAPTQEAPSLPLRVARQDPAIMGDQLRRAFLDWMRFVCALRPVVFVLEDLHWGDLPTVRMIDDALQDLQEMPFFLVALARPEVKERFPRLWEERGVEEMALRGLSQRACEEMIGRALGNDTPSRVTSQMIETAGGNAFYLEELIRAQHEGRGEELPHTVLAMVQARIEALPEQARYLLRAASLLGEGFSLEALAYLSRGALEESEVLNWLSRLVEQEILLCSLGQRRYQFRHSLMREAAYAMLTPQDRALGHRLTAQWLEESGEEDARTIAEHLERGDEMSKAAPYFALAAHEALEGNDLRAAVECADRAIQDGLSGESLDALRAVQMEAYLWLGNPAAASQCVPELLYRFPEGSALWYRVLAGSFMSSLQLRDFERAMSLVSMLEASSPLADAGRSLAQAISVVVTFGCVVGLSSLSHSLLQKMERLQVETISTSKDIEGFFTLGWKNQAQAYGAFYLTGDPWSYLERSNAAVKHFERAGDLRSTLANHLEVCRALVGLGAFAQAERLLEERMLQIKRFRIGYLSPFAKLFYAQSLRRRGEIKAAQNLLTEVIEEFGRNGHAPRKGDSQAELGRVFLALGQREEARSLLEGALAPTAFILPVRAKLLATLSYARRELKDIIGAKEAAQDALSTLEDLGGVGFEEAYIRLSYIEALLSTKEIAIAKDALFEAKERLLSRAQRIQEPSQRESFLHNIEENRLTLELADRWGV